MLLLFQNKAKIRQLYEEPILQKPDHIKIFRFLNDERFVNAIYEC